ncbi:HupE/UreJ family protein [Xanthobacter sp. V3C-3]|uniref:HupE/UreJ family protein n=1 Tax=Xanthobacter lutulentifluminis TaxID=3119935 RepID=UPI0037269156
MHRILRTAGAAAALTLLPQLAFAHTGVGAVHGFNAGFAHPMGGLDHLLAMVTVGIFAYQLGGRALWAVPATFVALMAVGGALGISGIDVPFVELGIALSVVVLGAAVAFGVKAPLAAALAIVGFFAIFHGHAHGAEMPADASGLAYGLGFMSATALLHLAGLGLGMAIGRFGEAHGEKFVRGAGAAVAVAGVGLLAGLV